MTLAEIYYSLGLKLKFRVRNVRTLHDYIILAIHTWDSKSVRSKPESMYCFAFQSAMHCYLQADHNDFVPLSTKEEVKKAEVFRGEWMISHCADMYRYGPNKHYQPFGQEPD